MSGSQAKEAAPGTLAQVGDQASTLIPRQCWPRLRERARLALGSRDVLRLQVKRRPGWSLNSQAVRESQQYKASLRG